ncbi:MAG TPA: hypothetical protein PKW90_04685 [Myxococcota bacterium]|nr:hypothetical protein [Myxococcota bacterium]
MWSSLRFEIAPPRVRAAPARADVACFVGYATVRAGDVPAGVRAQLREFGWEIGVSLPQALPVVVESHADFTALFEPLIQEGSLSWESYLSGAIRDFFALGGLRAWVVAVAPAGPSPQAEAEANSAIDKLLPGFVASTPQPSPHERSQWKGIWQLLGIPEVSLVCLPDLPSLLGDAPTAPVIDVEAPVVLPQFVECAPPAEPVPPQYLRRIPGAPRTGVDGRERWSKAVRQAIQWLGRFRPDVLLVAALPLAERGSPAEKNPLESMEREGLLASPDGGGIASAWLQATWPWVAGDRTRNRPGGIAPADGILAGMIARGALEQGCFRSLRGFPVEGIRALEPRPSPRILYGSPQEDSEIPERLTVLGPATRGFRLLSDTTLSRAQSWRNGGVGRLMGVVRRSLIHIGEPFCFEPSGPQTWKKIQQAVEEMLGDLLQEGALAGFQVRCDRSTMSQQDLDQGRMRVEVGLKVSTPIERILVVLSVENGQLHLSGEG